MKDIVVEANSRLLCIGNISKSGACVNLRLRDHNVIRRTYIPGGVSQFPQRFNQLQGTASEGPKKSLLASLSNARTTS